MQFPRATASAVIGAALVVASASAFAAPLPYNESFDTTTLTATGVPTGWVETNAGNTAGNSIVVTDAGADRNLEQTISATTGASTTASTSNTSAAVSFTPSLGGQ